MPVSLELHFQGLRYLFMFNFFRNIPFTCNFIIKGRIIYTIEWLDFFLDLKSSDVWSNYIFGVGPSERGDRNIIFKVE